ncbi:AP2 domain-containing protein [Paenibacillus ginsengihumi]|uniref:AP2 domain-containing protein n=1 Tax=Paenibacillus ginsengihumi TaxID=431596 RepID=UPI0003682C0A|nr:AP2 domain-containing protein [Paenibacillus ginsengihumi]
MKNSYEIRGNVTAIFVKRRNGEIAETIIDTEDLPKANSIPTTWYLNPSKNAYYVRADVVLGGKRRKVYLHRWLCDVDDDLTVDHFNHDTLDNRRSVNLRVITNSENQQNRTVRRDSRTRMRGVEYRPDKKKYAARLSVNKKRYNIGHFDDARSAERAVMKARKLLMPYSKEGSNPNASFHRT